MTHPFVCSYRFFPKRKVFFEVAFHGNIGVRFFVFSDFLFPSIISMKGLNEIVIIVTFYFIFCSMTVFFLGMSISNALAHHIRSSNLLSRFHAKVSKIGWNLDVGGTNSACIGRDSVCCYYLLESYRDWNGIPKLLPYSWIPEGRWGFESAWFWFFCIFIFQCSCFCLSYSLTVIWITPNWLLFVFCYSCPAPLCWIRNLS